jgi:hypothetical protein
LTNNNRISISIKCCFNIDKYNHFSFLNYLHENSSFCYLCNKKHPLKFHGFVKRNYKQNIDQFQQIFVIRIFCNNNFRQRKATGGKQQYTLTLLPAFLAPYSKIPVPIIEKNINQYIQSPAITQTEMAMRMNCENRKSFMLYLNRIKKRINTWIMLVVQMTAIIGKQENINLNNTLVKNDLKNQWLRFKQLYCCYFIQFHKIPQTETILEKDYFSSIHAIFTQNRMGLGP